MNQKEKKQVDVTDNNHNLSLRENRNIWRNFQNKS